MKIIGAFLLTVCLAANASAQAYPVRAAEKLGTGLINLLSAPTEPFIGAYHMSATFDKWGANDGVGGVLGFFMGLGGTVVHTVQAAADIATFFVAPKDVERELYWTVFDYEEFTK